MIFFFFKQKTAYEMRISDWSSDVCSSDLYLFHWHLQNKLCFLPNSLQYQQPTNSESQQHFQPEPIVSENLSQKYLQLLLFQFEHQCCAQENQHQYPYLRYHTIRKHLHLPSLKE